MLAEKVEEAAGERRALPPVHLWNPSHVGEIDMRIARDGTWYYLGTPIPRPAMVRLFSTVLRRDDDGRHYLVTPAEKLAITVEDAPFMAVAMEVAGSGRAQRITFRTNVGDEVTADAEHPIRVEIDPETEEPAPYVLVRARLEALLSRPVFYELVDLAEVREGEEGALLGVWSAGRFFVLGPAPEEGEED